MLNGDAVDHLTSEGASFITHAVTIREEQPQPDADDCEKDDEHANELAGFSALQSVRYFHILVTESNAFNDFTVADQRTMCLFARIGAKAVSRVNGEGNQITIEMFAFRA